MKEIWKDIKDYKGMYQISDLGRVKSVCRQKDNSGSYSGYMTINEKILSLVEWDGYLKVSLTKNSISKSKRVHKLVAIAFIENKDNKKEVNHINGNKKDNRVINLEWVTAKENIKHAYNSGLMKNNTREGGKKKQILCLSNNLIFESSYQAAEWLNTKFDNKKIVSSLARGIRKVASGKHKIFHNLKWKFIN